MKRSSKYVRDLGTPWSRAYPEPEHAQDELGVKATRETTPHIRLVARGKNHRLAPPLNGEAKKVGPPGKVLIESLLDWEVEQRTVPPYPGGLLPPDIQRSILTTYRSRKNVPSKVMCARVSGTPGTRVPCAGDPSRPDVRVLSRPEGALHS